MAGSTSSSSFSSLIPLSLHDVFLSFHGQNTRTSFSSHLLAALDRHRFSTFRDDTKLRSGENISSQLLKAIEEARVSIVVFSMNYADSKWCLNELVKIMECRRDLNRIVLPIFYDVDPSHVRAQLETYAKAFAKHEDRVKEGRLSMERVDRWRAALTEAANVSGHALQHGDESKLIKEVVEEIVKRLDGLYLHVADHPVGIDSRVQELKAKLNLGLNDVRIVGIWGVGGIGKTTIAKAIFNRIRTEFEGSSFLADVRETAKKPFGMVELQKQLLSNILMDDNYNLENYHHGIEVIKRKLCHLRVLLVLDDVDDVQHLKMLAINCGFGSGSRIIITTRNKTSLTSLQVNSFYSLDKLNRNESLELFSWNAFATIYPKEGHRQISNEIVAYAEGLPLVLEVWGSFLAGRSITGWKSELDKLKIIPIGDIQQKLEISFNSLDDINQDLFLDIAFFFIGRDRNFTVKVLEDPQHFPESGIEELARRCLVRVNAWGILSMHNVLRDMGREIVRKQSKKPGERSRLWCREEVLQVLQDCTGTEAIKGLSLELSTSNNEHVDTKAFANMSDLRLLHLNYLQRISGTYITSSRNLKWLCWYGFPFASIPAALYMENLVAIDLQYSKLKKIWMEPKRLDKLRFLNLSHSYYLIETPDFSGLKRLEILLLNDCKNLVKVHNSIGCLDKVLVLNMANCINLTNVPPSLFMMKSLEKLDFSGCSKLRELAEGKGLFSMFLRWLTKHQEEIPISTASIQGLSCLQELYLAGCSMEYVPGEIGGIITLKIVDLSGNKFRSLPSSFSHLSRLNILRLDRCAQLESLADLPRNLEGLAANDCISLKSVSVGKHCPTYLAFGNCTKLLDGKNLCNNLARNYLGVHQVPFGGSYYYHLIYPSGDLPNDIQFQGIGSESLSFVVPPLVGKKIISLIVCAVVPYNSCIGDFLIVNKTKGNNCCYRKDFWNYLESCDDHSLLRSGGFFPIFSLDEDHVVIIYEAMDEPKFTLEGGDEVELRVCSYFSFSGEAVVKKLGFSFIFEDHEQAY